MAVQEVRRSGAASEMRVAGRSLRPDQQFAVPGGGEDSVAAYMARNRTAGVLILKNGQVALEAYGLGCGPDSRWTSFSFPLVSTTPPRIVLRQPSATILWR